MTIRLKQEITVWDKAPTTPNHIYITDGGKLVGYIKSGTTDAVYFSTPSKLWSPSRRKFREITGKKERAKYNF